MGGAIALSVLAHALALGLWLHSRMNEGSPPSIGQKRGGLMVTLLPPSPAPQSLHRTGKPAAPAVAPPHPAIAPRTLPRALAASPDAQATAPHAPEPQPDPAPHHEAAVQAAPSTAPTAHEEDNTAAQAFPALKPTPPLETSAERPGARFASLFAPIVSRPMGHGRWNTSPAPMPPDTSAAMQREQAIQGLRQALTTRVGTLTAQMRLEPLSGSCDIRISLDSQTGQLTCSDPADLQKVSPSLSGLITLAATFHAQANDTCMKASGTDIIWVTCPAAS